MFRPRPRLDPRCYIGEQRYFLTFCTNDRHHAFTNRERARSAVSQILHASDERSMAVIAYVVMPDHVHLLVEGLDAASDMCSFAHLTKQRTGHDYSKAMDRRLWQPSYWDHVLRDEESTWDVARYICDNPVRRGLVERWEDYEFTGSGIMDRVELKRELASHPARSWQP
jgi:REP element-mobilizing transposase RayT